MSPSENTPHWLSRGIICTVSQRVHLPLFVHSCFGAILWYLWYLFDPARTSGVIRSWSPFCWIFNPHRFFFSPSFLHPTFIHYWRWIGHRSWPQGTQLKSSGGSQVNTSNVLWKVLSKILRKVLGKASWRRWHLGGTWKDEQGFFWWHGVGIKKAGRRRAVTEAQSYEDGVSLICPRLWCAPQHGSAPRTLPGFSPCILSPTGPTDFSSDLLFPPRTLSLPSCPCHSVIPRLRNRP